MSFLLEVKQHRFGLLALLTAILIAVSFLTRFFLLVFSGEIFEASFFTIVEIFAIGLVFDFANATYFTIPLLIYLWLVPQRLYSKRAHDFALIFVFFFFTFLIVFNSFSEWFFWEEFSTRFNFIAVDYLVYTTEVLGNIRQSYPIEWYISAALGITSIIVYNFRSWILIHK